MRKRKEDQLIYETALSYFAKYGYKKTTLEDIAGALNMTNANIYSYADSKLSLYHAAVKYTMDKWQLKIFNAMKRIEDPVEQFKTMSLQSITYLSQDEIFCNILKNDQELFAMFPTIDVFEDTNKRSLDCIKWVLKRGITKGVFADINTEITANILFNVYKSFIIENYIRGEKPDVLTQYDDIINLLLNGLQKR